MEQEENKSLYDEVSFSVYKFMHKQLCPFFEGQYNESVEEIINDTASELKRFLNGYVDGMAKGINAACKEYGRRELL
jgi:hypothetical protein